ncbi:MAG: hypothetical protein ABI748_12615, partial [Dokdonella sp.]
LVIVSRRLLAVYDVVSSKVPQKRPASKESLKKGCKGVSPPPIFSIGLSGTCLKIGIPHDLSRFVTERMLTVNTTVGGNASLLTLGE